MAIRCHCRSLVMAGVAVAAAGCADPSAPVRPRPPVRGATAISHATSGLLNCDVTIESGLTRPIGGYAPTAPTIECSPPPARSRGGEDPDRIVFASDTILERFDDIGFAYGTPTWSLIVGAGTVTVPIMIVNHIAKPLGTTDGAHPAANGTRVFIVSGPTVLVGSGLGVLPTVTVNNSTGTGTFTSTGQKYFQYSGIIKPDSASTAMSWTFAVLDVSKFNFQVGVDAITP
jgi:hypothetical protein